MFAIEVADLDADDRLPLHVRSWDTRGGTPEPVVDEKADCGHPQLRRQEQVSLADAVKGRVDFVVSEAVHQLAERPLALKELEHFRNREAETKDL